MLKKCIVNIKRNDDYDLSQFIIELYLKMLHMVITLFFVLICYSTQECVMIYNLYKIYIININISIFKFAMIF